MSFSSWSRTLSQLLLLPADRRPRRPVAWWASNELTRERLMRGLAAGVNEHTGFTPILPQRAAWCPASAEADSQLMGCCTCCSCTDSCRESAKQVSSERKHRTNWHPYRAVRAACYSCNSEAFDPVHTRKRFLRTPGFCVNIPPKR